MPAAAARLLLLGLLAVPGAAVADGPPAVGLMSGVTFTVDAAEAHGAELARRTLGPLTALRLRATLTAGPLVDLARERFTLYVPATAPVQGYGLLVYVSSRPDAAVPARWAPILDRHGLIFVVAANAGNDAKVFERREPLALIAARNVLARYPVDPSHVFVGGFSGGARVAERLALAYPDLFRGAVLDAGSDPLGAAIPPPPADLMRRFQEASRLAYLTGGHDDFHLAEDRRSQQSMADWCVFGVAEEIMPWSGHDEADPASLDRALDDLARPTAADPAKLEACRAGLARQMAAQFRAAEALGASGDRDRAWALLARIDARYGGLAATGTLALAARLATRP